MRCNRVMTVVLDRNTSQPDKGLAVAKLVQTHNSACGLAAQDSEGIADSLSLDITDYDCVHLTPCLHDELASAAPTPVASKNHSSGCIP